MLENPPEPTKPILLTGAGFTKNFGGFLADDMRAFVADRIMKHRHIVKLLNSRLLSYEDVYTKVIYGKYSEEDKSALTAAFVYAYKRLDDVIRGVSWESNAPHGVNIYEVKNFLDRFGSTVNGKRAYFFTLNQDLFIERWYGQGTPLRIPGNLNLVDMDGNGRRELKSDDFLPVPAANKIDTIRAEDNKKTSSSGRYHYLKLHGSFNWYDGKNPERRIMVIGGQKLKQIENQPILQYYNQKFREILTQPSRKLCVIGYSFRDKHVNNIIREALTKCDLKLYIISPQSHSTFAKQIVKNDPENGPTIRDEGQCWPWELRQIFPTNQTHTVLAEQINNALFE